MPISVEHESNIFFLYGSLAVLIDTITAMVLTSRPIADKIAVKKPVLVLHHSIIHFNSIPPVNDNLQQQAMALYAEMFLNSSNNDVTSGTLSDIAVITMGQSPSGSSYNEDGVG